MKTKTPKGTKSDILFDIAIYGILFVLFLIIVLPLLNVMANSLSSANASMMGKVGLWPVDFSLESYRMVFSYKQVWAGYLNSMIITSLGTCLNLTLTLTAAYSLSRKDFFGGTVLMGLFVFTMLFSGGLIPNYLLMRDLKILNTWWALVLPVGISVYSMIVAKTFFQTTIPLELHEAAQMEGCDDFNFFFRFVLPLSGPIIAVLTLWYAVDHWNSYFNALLYIKDEKLFPLQIILRNILISNKVDDLASLAAEDVEVRQAMAQVMKYSLIVIASVPMIVNGGRTAFIN